MMNPNKDNTVTIEGFYDWGPGVAVTAECLGRSFETTIGPRRLRIALPSFDGTSVTEPTLLYRRPDNWANVDPANAWGELRVAHRTDDGTLIPRTVLVKRARIILLINGSEAEDPNIGPQIDAELTPWWDELSSWVEVITGQDLATPGDRRPAQPQHFHLWTGNPDGTMKPLSMMFQLTFRANTNALTCDGLSACLAAVARGQTPPPERLHLSDARSLHNNGQWRRAVIDAATAAEVSITSWLDNRLNTAEPEVKSALLNTPLTLGRLHKLYTHLGGVLPSNFDNLVVKPRNDAAHRGMTLTEDQSTAAITATQALLDAASPIRLVNRGTS